MTYFAPDRPTNIDNGCTHSNRPGSSAYCGQNMKERSELSKMEMALREVENKVGNAITNILQARGLLPESSRSIWGPRQSSAMPSAEEQIAIFRKQYGLPEGGGIDSQLIAAVKTQAEALARDQYGKRGATARNGDFAVAAMNSVSASLGRIVDPQTKAPATGYDDALRVVRDLRETVRQQTELENERRKAGRELQIDGREAAREVGRGVPDGWGVSLARAEGAAYAPVAALMNVLYQNSLGNTPEARAAAERIMYMRTDSGGWVSDKQKFEALLAEFKKAVPGNENITIEQIIERTKKIGEEQQNRAIIECADEASAALKNLREREGQTGVQRQSYTAEQQLTTSRQAIKLIAADPRFVQSLSPEAVKEISQTRDPDARAVLLMKEILKARGVNVETPAGTPAEQFKALVTNPDNFHALVETVGGIYDRMNGRGQRYNEVKELLISMMRARTDAGAAAEQTKTEEQQAKVSAWNEKYTANTNAAVEKLESFMDQVYEKALNKPGVKVADELKDLKGEERLAALVKIVQRELGSVEGLRGLSGANPQAGEFLRAENPQFDASMIATLSLYSGLLLNQGQDYYSARAGEISALQNVLKERNELNSSKP